MSLMEKIFGNLNAKEVKKLEKIAEKVEALDEETAKLSDDELRAKTDEFKGRLAEGETLDDLFCLPRGCSSKPRNEALPRADYRWYRSSPGPYSRDEDW